MVTLSFNPRDPRHQRRLLEFCLGLSLNDIHWLAPDDTTRRWQEVNLYANGFLSHRIDALRSAYSNASPGGPVNVAFTGPGQFLDLIGMIPGLHKNAPAHLSGLTERTVKRHLAIRHGKVIFKGTPKTGGYYVK